VDRHVGHVHALHPPHRGEQFRGGHLDRLLPLALPGVARRFRGRDRGGLWRCGLGREAVRSTRGTRVCQGFGFEECRSGGAG
jgi:hypothetical protein